LEPVLKTLNKIKFVSASSKRRGQLRRFLLYAFCAMQKHLTPLLLCSTLFSASLTLADNEQQADTQPLPRRQSIELSVQDREKILLDMRNALVDVQQMYVALGEEDYERLNELASRYGMAAGMKLGKTLTEPKAIPMAFMQMSLPVHQKFDELSRAAKAGAPKEELYGRLTSAFAGCLPCHGVYELTVKGE
jgi:hypothetical protein